MFKNKLLSASKTFVNKTNEHCLVLTFDDGRTGLEGAGNDVWVKAMEDNRELFENVRRALQDAAEDLDPEKDLHHEHFPRNLPRLFSNPGTKKWKGVQIRSQLSKYLAFYGYGHNMPKRYGEDNPPLGWPVLVDWSKFKGPSKSCSLALCSEMIFQLLEEQGIDPMDYGPGHLDVATEEPSDATEEEIEDEDGQENQKRKKVKKVHHMISKNVVETIALHQEREERNVSVYERRRRNIEELNQGLRALEEGKIDE
jgi:hypothetical protein